jgi:hypothetical protein
LAALSSACGFPAATAAWFPDNAAATARDVSCSSPGSPLGGPPGVAPSPDGVAPSPDGVAPSSAPTSSSATTYSSATTSSSASSASSDIIHYITSR